MLSLFLQFSQQVFQTTEKISENTPDLKKHKEIKSRRQREHLVELQGEFKKLKLLTFNGELEEVGEAWLINIKRYF